MEKEKYFIPEIEDIYSGYEYEVRRNDGKWERVTEFSNDYDYEDNPHYAIMKDIKESKIRVSYLTKEQIENEGWTLQEEFPYVHSIGLIKNLTYKGTNHTVFLYYNYSSKWLLITIQSVIDNIYSIKYTTEKTDININGNTLYAGTCLDINTFRYICKLLEI